MNEILYAAQSQQSLNHVHLPCLPSHLGQCCCWTVQLAREFSAVYKLHVCMQVYYNWYIIATVFPPPSKPRSTNTRVTTPMRLTTSWPRVRRSWREPKEPGRRRHWRKTWRYVCLCVCVSTLKRFYFTFLLLMRYFHWKWILCMCSLFANLGNLWMLLASTVHEYTCT